MISMALIISTCTVRNQQACPLYSFLISKTFRRQAAATILTALEAGLPACLPSKQGFEPPPDNGMRHCPCPKTGPW